MSHAVIVAHGQPSDPEPAEAALAAFAAKVDALTGTVSVHSATLAAPGALGSNAEQCTRKLGYLSSFHGKRVVRHQCLAKAHW